MGDFQTPFVPLATIGNLSFAGVCEPEFTNNEDRVELEVKSAVAHSTYAAVTQAAAGGQLGDGDMPLNTFEHIADWTGPLNTPRPQPDDGKRGGGQRAPGHLRPLPGLQRP